LFAICLSLLSTLSRALDGYMYPYNENTCYSTWKGKAYFYDSDNEECKKVLEEQKQKKQAQCAAEENKVWIPAENECVTQEVADEYYRVEQQDCERDGKYWDSELKQCLNEKPKEEEQEENNKNECEARGDYWNNEHEHNPPYCESKQDKERRDCFNQFNIWLEDENTCLWVDEDYENYDQVDCIKNKYKWNAEKNICEIACTGNKDNDPVQCSKPGNNYPLVPEENEEDIDFSKFKDYRSCRTHEGVWDDEEKVCNRVTDLDINQCKNAGLNWDDAKDVCKASGVIDYSKLNETACKKNNGYWDEKETICKDPFLMDEKECKSNKLVWNESRNSCFTANDPEATKGLDEGSCSGDGLKWEGSTCIATGKNDNGDGFDIEGIDEGGFDLGDIFDIKLDENFKVSEEITDVSGLFTEHLGKARWLPHQCPVPRQINVMGKSITLDWSPMCTFAEVIGHLIVILAGLKFCFLIRNAFIGK